MPSGQQLIQKIDTKAYSLVSSLNLICSIGSEEHDANPVTVIGEWLCWLTVPMSFTVHK